MTDVAMINVNYLSKILKLPKYFDNKTGRFETISYAMKAIYSFLYVNPISLNANESTSVAFNKVAKSLNLDDNTCGMAVLQLRQAQMLSHYKVNDEVSCLSACKSKKIILSEEIELDSFLSTLPDNYVSHYLYIKHHQDIVDNKLTMTIEEISKATGVNPPEIGFMNKLFKEMGYFSITKETKTGTNIYEVIK